MDSLYSGVDRRLKSEFAESDVETLPVKIDLGGGFMKTTTSASGQMTDGLGAGRLRPLVKQQIGQHG